MRRIDMLKASESTAVAIARTHVQAWSNHDYDTARQSLAPDVEVTIATTMNFPTTHLAGIDDYMRGLTEFAKNVKPGSLRVDASVGDERNALIMITVRAEGTQYGAMTLQMARLYLFDDNDKIKVEHVTYYTVPD